MTMELTDTHCHIHEAVADTKGDNPTRSLWLRGGNVPDPDEIIQAAKSAGVTRLVCVGTTVEDSELSVNFVQNRQNCWASIGLHPHEASHYADNAEAIDRFRQLADKPKVVAIGETGLDYYYEHSPKADQKKLLRMQLGLAADKNLPLIFHIRDAFKDFWRIYDNFKGLRGVVHSFTATRQDLDEVLARGLYVGLNGIMTFTKNQEQLLAAKAIPLQNLLLETDAPFLTPAPYRGTICEPKHVGVTAEFLAGLRDEDMAALAQATTQNACNLFGLK
jgi:TatD DNase family protein